MSTAGLKISSVQFSRSVMSNSVTPWPATFQASLSITNSPILLKLMPIESEMPFNHFILCRLLLLLPSIFPSIREWVRSMSQFPMSQFFATGGQSIGVSASASVLQMNLQDWFPLGRTGWISLQSKGLSRAFSNTTIQKHILQPSAFFIAQPSYPYMTTGENIALTRWTFIGKVMSLLIIILFRLVIAFLPRSKHLLISWLQSLSELILEPHKNNICHCFQCFPIYMPWSDGTRCHDLRFLNVEF